MLYCYSFLYHTNTGKKVFYQRIIRFIFLALNSPLKLQIFKGLAFSAIEYNSLFEKLEVYEYPQLLFLNVSWNDFQWPVEKPTPSPVRSTMAWRPYLSQNFLWNLSSDITEICKPILAHTKNCHLYKAKGTLHKRTVGFPFWQEQKPSLCIFHFFWPRLCFGLNFP